MRYEIALDFDGFRAMRECLHMILYMSLPLKNDVSSPRHTQRSPTITISPHSWPGRRVSYQPIRANCNPVAGYSTTLSSDATGDNKRATF